MASARAETQRRRTSNTPVPSSGYARAMVAGCWARQRQRELHCMPHNRGSVSHQDTRRYRTLARAGGSGNTLSRINISAPRTFTCPPLRGGSAHAEIMRPILTKVAELGFRDKSDHFNLERKARQLITIRTFFLTTRVKGAKR